jgi:hypothetical protein
MVLKLIVSKHNKFKGEKPTKYRPETTKT